MVWYNFYSFFCLNFIKLINDNTIRWRNGVNRAKWFWRYENSGPMDYEEFCDVTGNSQRLLNQIYDSGSPIGQATNRKLMRDLRIYMAVGGMPQAVEAYVAGKNFSEIDMVKRQIITLYEEDFKKIDTSGSLLLKPFYLVPFISV